jgi:hypothetical protein
MQLRNAFDKVDFGAWDSGIFKATFDNFMHSTKSGLFEYIADLVFDGLTKTEKQEVEMNITRIFLSTRSSVRYTYPRWCLKDSFSNRQTQITCGEKVGSVWEMLTTTSHIDTRLTPCTPLVYVPILQNRPAKIGERLDGW